MSVTCKDKRYFCANFIGRKICVLVVAKTSVRLKNKDDSSILYQLKSRITSVHSNNCSFAFHLYVAQHGQFEYPPCLRQPSHQPRSKVGLKTITLSVGLKVMQRWEPAAVQTKAHFPLVTTLLVSAMAEASWNINVCELWCQWRFQTRCKSVHKP